MGSSTSMIRLGRALALAGCLLFGTMCQALAGVIQIPGGYQATYSMYLSPGTATGADVKNVYFFEWDQSNHFRVSDPYVISNSGVTTVSHVIDFMPTSAFAIGYLDGDSGAEPGTFESKRHLYTLVNPGYLDYLQDKYNGQKFSEIFGIVEQVVADWIHDAATSGDADAMAKLTTFVQDYVVGKEPAFDPAGSFQILHWSVPGPGGGNVPEPGISALVAAALCAVGLVSRRRRGLRASP